MGDVITTTLLILLAIALIVVAVVGLKHILRYFLNGVKETWDLSGQIGPIGHGLLIAGWIFFFPFALVITVITGWSKTRAGNEIPQYNRALEIGEKISSTFGNPYEIKLHSKAKATIPEGEWTVLHEGDFEKTHGSILTNAILSGDNEYVSLYLGTDKLPPKFVWMFDAQTPSNFLLITVVDTRFEENVKSLNLGEEREFYKEMHSRDKKLETYSLELEQLDLPGYPEESLIQYMRYRPKGKNNQMKNYTISLVGKPFTVVFSSTCRVSDEGRYRDLTLQLANSYQTQ